MLFLKLVHIWRRVRILLHLHDTDGKKLHPVFTLPIPMHPLDFYLRLIPQGYQFCLICTHYRGQIFSVRRLIGEFQYHLRLYDDGTVTGHYEWNYEFDPVSHSKGMDCRNLHQEEIDSIFNALKK